MPGAVAEGDNARNMTMLVKATKVLHEHMKDMTEKTRGTSCFGKPHNNLNNQHQNNQNNNNNNNPETQVVLDNIFKSRHQRIDYHDPNITRDSKSGATYRIGGLLGKGGFAKCYEMLELETGLQFAGKIISKTRLTKQHQKDKIAREIELHRDLQHANVVGFRRCFEDDNNVYIILEKCSKKSLVHMLRNRKTLTEAEVRYFLKQLVKGVEYIHAKRIVHRDLKLGNMLLSGNHSIKIGDFGLATRIEFHGEKKMSVCGTPNYIAPEVLQKKGHSYEADIWAIGCIMYAMLVGRPPFETSTLKETYQRITANKYHVPSSVSVTARQLITWCLQADANHRPTLAQILDSDFMTSGFMPDHLPSDVSEVAPKFPINGIRPRPKSYAVPVTPTEAMQKITSSITHVKGSKRSATPSPTRMSCSSKYSDHGSVSSRPSNLSSVPPSTKQPLRSLSTPNVREPEPAQQWISPSSPDEFKAHHHQPTSNLVRLHTLLKSCIEEMPHVNSHPTPVSQQKPMWVTKWVDYSNKYGFGFQLSDKSVGVLFNDSTRMLLTPSGKTVQYKDLSNKVMSFAEDSAPRDMRKKTALLLYFAKYMDDHLIHGGDVVNQAEDQEPSQAIFMKKWFRTNRVICMYLNHGIIQVNFFEDHTKLILNPAEQDYMVTYINNARQSVTYKLLQLRHFGCHPDIAERLEYLRSILHRLFNLEGEAV